ncbi:MAG: flagellar biosynthetic protein FliO, partial [Duganella sp.]
GTIGAAAAASQASTPAVAAAAATAAAAAETNADTGAGTGTATSPAAPVTAPPATPAASDTTTAPNPARPPAPLGVPAAPHSAAPASGGLMQTTLALFFVIALLLGGAWFLKRFGPRNFGGGNNTVKLVGALSVGARERILVVEVGEQWIVVGASPGRMNALATMARQETPELPASAQSVAPTANFAAWLKQNLDQRSGKQ